MQMRKTSRVQDKKPVVNNNSKTHTMISRTQYMLEDGVNASSILMFTFTRKAANEIKERLASRCGDIAYGVTVGTYHSFCAKLLRKYCGHIGYQSNFTIMEPSEKESIVKEILKKMNDGSKPAIIDAQISKFKELHVSPTKALEYIKEPKYKNYKVAAEVYVEYQKRIKKNNVMDFDDLIYHMIDIIENNDSVRDELHKRYKYIVADEVQDSNTCTDARFIYLLTNPDTMNLCIVGDDDQSRTYAWHTSDCIAKTV